MTKRLSALAVAAAMAAVGCTKEPEVEKVAVGSDVQLTQKDGGVVQGKVTAKDEKTVQVQTGKTTKTVPKTRALRVPRRKSTRCAAPATISAAAMSGRMASLSSSSGATSTT